VNRPSSSRIRSLRATALAGLVMLVAEYGFGIWVNLYASVPRADHAGMADGAAVAVVNGGLARAVANGPAMLSVHIVLGMVILLTAIFVLVRAVLVRRTLPIVLAAVGCAAVLVAAGGGTRFLGDGASGGSFVMALGAGLAILCYAVILFPMAAPADPSPPAEMPMGERSLPGRLPRREA